jgi:8-oxo-dGTP pyrophosphatase MutT (NUDIX family)
MKTAASNRGEHGHFPSREDRVHKIEVHVAGIICRQRSGNGWSILAARRTASRSLFPNKWECGGGQVRPGEGFKGALARKMFEEFGLEVDPWFLLDTYEIHKPRGQKIIPGVRFACVLRGGTIRLNRDQFSVHKWLNLPVMESLTWIPGVDRAVENLTARVLQVSAGNLPPMPDENGEPSI